MFHSFCRFQLQLSLSRAVGVYWIRKTHGSVHFDGYLFRYFFALLKDTSQKLKMNIFGDESHNLQLKIEWLHSNGIHDVYPNHVYRSVRFKPLLIRNKTTTENRQKFNEKVISSVRECTLWTTHCDWHCVVANEHEMVATLPSTSAFNRKTDENVKIIVVNLKSLTTMNAW